MMSSHDKYSSRNDIKNTYYDNMVCVLVTTALLNDQF